MASYLERLFQHANHPFAVLSAQGRMFGANFGSVTTPLATAATTAIAARRPMAWLRIPNGSVVVPSKVTLLVEASGATTQGEAVIAITTNDVGNGTSDAGTTQPTNLNTGASGASGASLCSTRQLATADVTLETGYLELKRFSWAASAVNQDFTWRAADEDSPPTLRGPATLAVYIGGNAVNFFAQMEFAELLESQAT